MKGFLAIVLVLLLGSCAPNNVTVDKSLGNYFKESGVEGCFALLDNSNGEFTVYNLPRYRDSAYAPGSSFDLVSALVGLQTGIIANDSAVLAPAASKGLHAAFQTSDSAYFSEAAHRIGRDTLQHWLDTLSYGTKKIRSAVDSFWWNGSLRLTPDEQLGFVKRLYFGQLPFFKVNQEIVKNAMIREQNTAYTLAYKTGAGTWDTGRKKNIGWITGWLERDRQPRFFVATLESKDPGLDLPAAGTRMVQRILQKLDLMPGKQ